MGSVSCSGKLVGNFYSSDGTPTEALLDAQRSLEVALDEERLKGEQAQIFPPCNSQWTDTTGTMVWCSNKRLVLHNPNYRLFFSVNYVTHFSKLSITQIELFITITAHRANG